MSREISIQEALARLEAGKFSFQMSDCISNHIAAQSQKIEDLTTLTNEQGLDMMKRDLRIHTLEKEVAALNGMLLKALKSNEIISHGVETAKSAKEKFVQSGLPFLMQMIEETKPRFVAFYDKMARMAEDGWKDAQPQIMEFKKQLEKLSHDLYSKIKAAA